MGGMNEAFAAARALADGGDAFCPISSPTPANPAAHEATTGPELFAQLDGKIDILVCGVGDGRHHHGHGPLPQIAPARTQGRRRGACELAGALRAASLAHTAFKGIGAGFVPPVLDRSIIDEIVPIPTMRRSTPPGCSAALRRAGWPLVWRGARGAQSSRLARGAPRRTVAVVLPDSGERYSSTPFFVPPARRAARA